MGEAEVQVRFAGTGMDPKIVISVIPESAADILLDQFETNDMQPDHLIEIGTDCRRIPEDKEGKVLREFTFSVVSA